MLGRNALPSEQKRTTRVPEQLESNVTDCTVKLDGDISEGRERLSIAFDASDAGHAQFVNVMFVRERRGVDGEISMLMSGVVDTERLLNSTLDIFVVPLEMERRVEEKMRKEDEKLRDDRVSVPEVVLVTNTPPAETVDVIVDSSTFDDPLTVNALAVKETFVVSRPVPRTVIALLSVEVTSDVSYNPSFI